MLPKLFCVLLLKDRLSMFYYLLYKKLACICDADTHNNNICYSRFHFNELWGNFGTIILQIMVRFFPLRPSNENIMIPIPIPSEYFIKYVDVFMQ